MCSKSKILHDPEERLKKLLLKYKSYPYDVWLEKLFTYWFFATSSAPYNSNKAIEREDLITAQFYLNQALEYYTALIFILNKSFVSYRKWRLKEMKKLQYKPEDFESILRRVLTVKNWSKEEFKKKQEIIQELAERLKKKLIDSGVPKERVENPWKYG